MSFFRLIVESLVHHRRLQAAVALGVAAATAVLTGALVVGDSVRGSLRDLALDRLQLIDEVLVVPRFFRAELAGELNKSPEFQKHFALAAPVAMLEGTVENPSSHARATHVNILGIDDSFAALSAGDPAEFSPPAPGQVYLNQPLADELQLTTGQDCIVRLPIAREVPADSALGRKTETITSLRLKIQRIVPDRGLGRFALRPSQSLARDAFLNMTDIQQALKQQGHVNAILVGHGAHAANEDAVEELSANHDVLESLLHPTLVDYGFTIRETPLGYFVVESDRMILEPAAVVEAEKAFGPLGAQPAFTYLANTLADGDREIPYSTITAIDFSVATPAGGFKAPDGQPVPALAADEIALNSWAAEDLGAKVGDTIRVSYFEPESTHGAVRESTVELRLAAIVELAGAAADPNLTPTLPGVTDQLSIADWNPPFPFESERVRLRDEEYWNEYKATPKAFVALATGRLLWSSRFGDTTSLRIPAANGRTVASLTEKFHPDPRALGFSFQPAREKILRAAVGTTAFEGLFIGFSFFIIAAALMLVAILFRLGVDVRAGEVGLLFAMGWGVRRVRRLLLADGTVVALAGAIFGAALGVAYAWLMIVGLRTWWVDAIRTPFLALHVRPLTLVIGTLSGVLISLAVIYWSLARLRRLRVRALLSQQSEDSGRTPLSKTRRAPRVAWSLAVLAAFAALAAGGLSDASQALAFLGSGTLVLAALLTMASYRLRYAGGASLVTAGPSALVRLALRNAGRNPTRSTLTIGLIAAASFIIIAISAFRLDPDANADSRSSGTGGFSLVAEADQPIYQDLNTEDGQLDLGFSSADQKSLAGTHVFAMRMAGGDDASCLNLYQAAQPRVLGLPESLVSHGGFRWSATAAATPETKVNPWLLLDQPVALPAAEASDQVVVPAILDEATAKYALHLSGVGARYTITDGRGRPLELQIVGLLSGSVLQGSLLISERNLLAHFPDTAGYRFFLIEAPAVSAPAVLGTLEKALGDFGFDATPAAEKLAEYYAVQNTYLSTFQSLGGLGLLLGTFGLAAVQLRSVVERRAELALLRAVGFRRALVARMVMLENGLLLVGGLVIGCSAAFVAILPHILAGAAHLPWVSTGATLAVVLAVGLMAGMSAVMTAVRAPVLSTLRSE